MNTYKRFFAFGCSFTSWHWPTWADIIGQQFSEKDYYNFGICASGNEFAFNRLAEAHARFNIDKDDLVIICWTNFAREDRYINGAWQTAGNIFTQDFYPKEWVKKWFDIKGALIKTSGCIVGASHLLDSTKCTYLFTSMMPMQQIDQFDSLFASKELEDVFTTYQKYYDKIQISMVEHLYGKGNWINPEPIKVKFFQTDNCPWEDHHPTPIQHLRYVDEVIMNNIKNIDISPATKNWIYDWQSKLTSKEYHVCDLPGWTFHDRWQKFHARML